MRKNAAKAVEREDSELLQIIGGNIRFFCKARGLTHTLLSERMGVTKNFLSEVLSARRALSFKTLLRVSRILDIEAYRFLVPGGKEIMDVQDYVNECFDRFCKDVAGFNKFGAAGKEP